MTAPNPPSLRPSEVGVTRTRSPEIPCDWARNKTFIDKALKQLNQFTKHYQKTNDFAVSRNIPGIFASGLALSYLDEKRTSIFIELQLKASGQRLGQSESSCHKVPTRIRFAEASGEIALRKRRPFSSDESFVRFGRDGR